MASNQFDLDGKVALVTGGNGGIGLGMAAGLARAGADIVIWGKDAAKNVAAREMLSIYGHKVLVQEVDVSREDLVIEQMHKAISTMGRLDFVAANAGVSGAGATFAETTTEAWRQVTQINLDSVFWTLREACKHMIQRSASGDPGGSLLVTSSTSAMHGAPRNEAYASSKAAVLALIRSIAVEHARYGVRANAVLPGWVRSNMTTPLQAWDKFNEKAIGRVPLGRWGEPEDFAGIAVYLASDLSKFHTGDAIVIDGGYTVF